MTTLEKLFDVNFSDVSSICIALVIIGLIYSEISGSMVIGAIIGNRIWAMMSK